MLNWDVRVLRAQWPFVRGHSVYEDAYYEGIAFAQATYGERALWQMVANARSGQWAEAIKAFRVLLRCYPQGLLNLFKLKASNSFGIRKLIKD